jgi:hypothetical protein
MMMSYRGATVICISGRFTRDLPVVDFLDGIAVVTEIECLLRHNASMVVGHSVASRFLSFMCYIAAVDWTMTGRSAMKRDRLARSTIDLQVEDVWT